MARCAATAETRRQFNPATIAFLVTILLSLPAEAREPDRNWFRQTLRHDLARYRANVLAPNGLLRPLLNREWQPYPKQTATLVSQTRLLFVMSAGYELTADKWYREAAREAGDFTLEHFRDSDHGGWFRRVSANGAVLDDSKDSYSHAFAIFGMVQAWRVTREDRFLRAAFQTWAVMKSHLRDGEVLIRPRTTREFSGTLGVNSQNPMMHLFEALLALYDASGEAEVRQDAAELATAIFHGLYREPDEYLPELFDAQWRPLAPEKGGRIELGHQLEWAWLLSEAVRLGVLSEDWLALGHGLLDFGIRYGYDTEAGGFFSRADYNRRVVDRTKGWWQQCEGLRAVLRYAMHHGREDLWPAFESSLRLAKERFIDPEHGGWFQKYDPNKSREGKGLDKGTHWMAGYHVTNLYLEAITPRRPPG